MDLQVGRGADPAAGIIRSDQHRYDHRPDFRCGQGTVPGARITITNLGTNAVVRVKGSDDGNYAAASLLPGQYRVSVEKEGFSKSVIEPVDVFTASVASVDVVLQVGSVNETVTVSSEAPLLAQDSAAINATIENKLLQDMPFPERSALGAVMLAPGIQGDPQYPGGIQSENAGIYTQPVLPGGSIQVGGARPGGGSILVDGSDISLASYPRTGVTFSGDTIREVSVQVLGIPAQYGRTGGGIINQTTRGGTNQFHGSASWQHIDPGLMAWTHGSHQSGVPPQRHQNLFGATFGGPVVLPKVYNGRDRTFFYVSVEPARLSDLVYSGAGRLPTPAELTGDLAYGYDMINRCCAQTLRTQGADAAIAQLRQLYATGQGPQLHYQFDRNANGFPYGPRYTSAADYVPIPGNNLTAQLKQNPLAQQLLSYYPTPSKPVPYAVFFRPDGLWDANGNNAFLARGVRNTDNRSSYRLDHQISSNSRLAFRYTYVPVQGTRFNLFGPDSVVNSVPQDQSAARNIYLGHTQLFGSNKVNEFRATYMRANQFRYGSPIASSKDWGPELGLRPATQGYGFPAFSGLPGSTLGSGGSIGFAAGTTLDSNTGIADDFSWVRGNHNLKFGFDYRAYQMNRYDRTDLGGGTYNFSASQTNDGVGGGSALASFMLGILNSYSVRTTLVPFYYRWKYYGGYVQDDWKVQSNLTVNVGLRYSVETPRKEKYNRQGSFDPNVTGTLNGIPVKGGFVFAGENGRSSGLWETNYMGFEPRIGFAYTPKRFVTIRASYAILRAPLTGQSTAVVPDLNVQTTPISGNNGGVNFGQVNLITNPIGPIPANQPLSGGPLFTWTGTGSAALPYIDTSTAVPYSQQWSYSMAFAVSRSTVVETTYAGNKGTHLWSPGLDMNLPSYDTIKQQIAAKANFGQQTPNPFGIRDSNGNLLQQNYLDTFRPYQHLWSQQLTSIFDRRGSSIYHALYVTFKQRMAKGLNVQGSYTWAKSIDDASSGAGGLVGQETDIFGLSRAQNPNNLRAERSESTFSIPHKFSAGWSWELPFGRGRQFALRNKLMGGLFGGWNLGGIATFQGGFPIWLRLGGGGYWFSQAGGANNLASGSVLRPDIISGVPIINPNWHNNPYVGGSFLNPAAFKVPGALDNPDFGNAPRTLSTVRNPITRYLDMNISKRFAVLPDGRLKATLRADFLNVLNHPNFFFNPNTGHDFLGGDFNRQALTNPAIQAFAVNTNFGRLDPNNTSPGRTIRLYIKFEF